ncbi:hypothetical protein DOTSEDRAFT_68258 [Dothistroma septosporum NZE10]|uniref:ER transporter 6TM N-terminal domain-containing protein n=1 Tax=Dothistroma septosporum (strain NZE10 / CBS 128990) TaxID=675120 RepID=N1Q2F5_DOTSN|nr:hypothetical protein DOTSEDRAFT_68258 [Dothistroma septosporum NZE10]
MPNAAEPGTENNPNPTKVADGAAVQEGVEETHGAPTKKPPLAKRIWAKTGLDLQTLILMFKGSLPPTIAIAMYQARDVASVYNTVGYLVAITSILGMCIMPRGRFLQSMLLNILAICVACAMCLLTLYTALQARLHTTAPGSPSNGYNSSASAVLAVWLIFQTYLTNVLRAALPQFQFPVIMYSIFLIVSTTYGVRFPNMGAAITFIETLLEAFLTGFAIATGVSLFIFPMSCRKVVFKEFQGYLGLLGGMLHTQAAYLRSLETYNPEAARRQREEQNMKKMSKPDKTAKPLLANAESAKLQSMLEKLYGLHTKLSADVKFAKREVAIGKLSSKDVAEVWKRMKLIMIPVTGLNTIIDVLKRADSTRWDNSDTSEFARGVRAKQVDDLHSLMQALHEPFSSMSATISGAFKHVLITLEIEKSPKKGLDEESKGSAAAPGSIEFAEAYKKQLDEFYESKQRSLREWCHAHDIELPQDFLKSSFLRPESIHVDSEHIRETVQRQLFFALYVEYLLWRAGLAALELVLYVDKRKQEGAMSKIRLIFPGARTLKKWAIAMVGREDESEEDRLASDLDSAGTDNLYLGESYSKRKDPEHLPPQTSWEKMGEVIRLLPRGLRSDASAFGFRVVCATMSIGIICYLEASQLWFLQNRLLWAMIMVPLSMTRTAGQSTWSFALRILGTAIAMTASYVIWYIVDGKKPGVIVFLWLWIFMAFYVVLKFPKFVIVGIISIVTSILIIGYELQVREIGVAASEANGQPAYPTYLLAPYRLATVCGGLFIAYFWTIFPYPVSESTEVRKDVGAALYLMANMYSVVHETVKSRIQKSDGNQNTKGSRAYHLEKARQQVFTKLIAILSALQQNSAFSKAQIRVGGRFPHEEYDDLITCLRRVLQYTSLIAYASGTFSTSSADSKWSQDFRKLLSSINATSHGLTHLLALLSNSMTHARPLPPYLDVPQHGKYIKTLESIDVDILSIRHIAEPEYSAFAVTTICAKCINDDIVKITKHVKTLVGEIDFSFHVISTSEEASDESSLSSDEEKKTKDA